MISQRSQVLLIIPAFNEAGGIVKLCQQIEQFNHKNHNAYDYIVINDCSTDATEDVLLEHHIPHITHLYNLGIGGAMQTGYKYAARHGYDVAVQFDGDGQHRLDQVSRLVQPILENRADLVVGSRFITKSGDTFRSTFARRVGIRILSSFIKFAVGGRIYDTTSGFRAASRPLLEEFAHYYPNEYPEPITTALAFQHGHNILEVPVTMLERTSGKSSIHSWKNVYYMFNVCLSLLIIKIRRK